MDISSLKTRIEAMQDDKSVKIHSQFQYEINEVWEMVDKKLNFGLLAGLAKRKPKEFRLAKEYLYGAIKDGQEFSNRGSYFLWLVKHYGEETNNIR